MTAVSNPSMVTVGVDIGTTSVKAVAVDADGTVVERARIPHPLNVPAADRLEHDSDRAWRRGVLDAYAAVSARQPVAGIQVAAMVPSLCAVDRSGQALTPGLLYGDARGGSPKVDDPADSGELLGFVRWCAAQAPEAAGLWPAQAMANHALCGTAAIDTVMGLMAAPLFDGTVWDPAVCAELGVKPDQLPAVVDSATPIGEVDGAPLGAGTIDAYAEQLCAGATEVGDVLVICGTTLIVWLISAQVVQAPGLWCLPTADGKAMLGGPSNAGGLFIEWAKRLAGAGDSSGLGDGGLQSVPVWVPYVRGERVLVGDPTRRAALHGLDLTHGPEQVRRAAYEATGFVVRHVIDRSGQPARRVVATGGGVRDQAWMAALADATGLPVDTVAVPEGAAYGAAFLARVVAGLEPDAFGAGRWASTGSRFEPDRAGAAAAADRYRQFRHFVADPAAPDQLAGDDTSVRLD
jgi:xylulokinase